MKKNRMLRIIVSGLCVAMILLSALAGVAADAASESQRTVKEVGSNVLYLYANPRLTGASSGSYNRGERITVSLNGDGSCTVYNAQGSAVGYCSPVDLVAPGTELFVQVPYLYSGDSRGKAFDLIDLDLYLAENASNIYKNVSDSGEEKIVLISRHLLPNLEKAATELAKSGIAMWVDAGYRSDASAPAPGNTPPKAGIPSYNTGCVIDLVLIKDNGEMNLTPNNADFTNARNTLQKYGFYLSGDNNYTFTYDDFEGCYGVNLDPSGLPRTALD